MPTADDKKVIFSMVGLSKIIRQNNKQVLKNIYLSFFYGAKIGIIGLNGAGKSTTIKSIAGLLRYEGEIKINGLPSKSVDAKKIFAYVPEIPAMFGALTVMEHIEYVRRAYRSQITDEEVEALLTRFEMSDKKDKLGDELSKGMMQKVSIICALCIKPEVILFDEPMVGLDPAAIKELKKVIFEMKDRGVTVLLSTHMLEMVQELWDTLYIMDHGKVIGTYENDGTQNQNIEDLFFSLTDKEDEKESEE